jgi:hypothetical protein
VAVAVTLAFLGRKIVRSLLGPGPPGCKLLEEFADVLPNALATRSGDEATIAVLITHRTGLLVRSGINALSQAEDSAFVAVAM